jgi:hypothetical protein
MKEVIILLHQNVEHQPQLKQIKLEDPIQHQDLPHIQLLQEEVPKVIIQGLLIQPPHEVIIIQEVIIPGALIRDLLQGVVQDLLILEDPGDQDQILQDHQEEDNNKKGAISSFFIILNFHVLVML